MTPATWFLLTTLVTWGFGRLAKFWPKLPKSALPWTALLFGYVITVLLAVRNGSPLVDALSGSWTGLLAGAAAVGGHEALKPFLLLVFSFVVEQKRAQGWATAILGKLPTSPVS